MKKLLIALLAVLVATTSFTFSGCSNSSGAKSAVKQLVGVAMPTQDLQRWTADGNNMKTALEKDGYQVQLQYANNDVNTQVQQCENMLTKGVKVLIIASIDGSALSDVCKQAASAKVKVIAYDRMIMKTANVDYFVSFDNFKIGALQGQYLESALNLKTATGPFNIELFAGSPSDNNATLFNNGAMSILQPYIDSGKLVVKSGQTKFEQISINNWETNLAQARMDNLITSTYAKGAKLDAVLSPNDSLAIGIIASLKSNGFGTASKPYPLLTGCDCDVANMKAIIAGQQTMSVFQDTRKLAAEASDMTNAILKETKVPVNDTTTYNNGVKTVPSYLLIPVAVDKNNYKSILIDGGYYTASQLQ